MSNITDPSNQDDQRQKLIEKHVALLREHFDSVQIFATIYESDIQNTFSYTDGDGNYMARFGHVSQWITRQNAEVAKNT